MAKGVVEGVAEEHNLRAACAHASYFNLRRSNGHHNGRSDAHELGCLSEPLSMIASGGAQHALAALFGIQTAHFIVGAANLKREHLLQVFALNKHLVVQARA